MYAYEWDKTTGGYTLISSHLKFSKEPRPVYYKELDLLGFDKYWNYEKNEQYPYMWAESSSYYYRGRLVAKTKGGSLYTKPELVVIDEPDKPHTRLEFVDIESMVQKNHAILESLVQNTIKRVYNTYIEYKNKVDIFYVAFSGGKDSVTVLDIVQRALPHNEFKVLFGNTGMEFPDTYDVINQIERICADKNIEFLTAKPRFTPEKSWKLFGPPSTTNRWCCSVHKTSPQINLLREKLGKISFTGMAYTGIRGDESMARSEYEDISLGGKHQGHFSCHPLLEWNSAELYLYIFANNLILNEAYKKGNSRAGCLICPMSSGKHEYMKRVWYKDETDSYINAIVSTSGKNFESDDDINDFVNNGYWKNRRSGRELNFDYDKFIADIVPYKTRILVKEKNFQWLEWSKTIGEIHTRSENEYVIDFRNRFYRVIKKDVEQGVEFTLPDCGKKKDEVKFLSLFRSAIIKSLYCVQCGVCEAECKHGFIKMNGQVLISKECVHCGKCHDIAERCLRYNSIRKKIGGGRKMKGMDRYYTFGIRKSWMKTYVKYKGSKDFWLTDGDGEVANKKKDAFLNFLKDSDMVTYDRSLQGDKFSKYKPTELTRIICDLGADSVTAWALMLVNLVYTPQFSWYIKNINFDEVQTSDHLKILLEDVTPNDTKGKMRRNIVDALKIFLIKTPIGRELGLGISDYDINVSKMGKETIKLHSFIRTSWEEPNPLVILYSLYKFAEACGNYYQFTLSRLLKYDIDSDGISPTEIFGLSRSIMEQILNGLSINYPEYISASFTLDLDNITLRDNKTSKDVLNLLSVEDKI